jgi:hypothetical protein
VAPVCKAQFCPEPPNVAFADIIQTSDAGTQAVYQCQTGFVIKGTQSDTRKRVTCDIPTQQWGETPQCESTGSTSCGDPPQVSNAWTSVESSGRTRKATYTCLPKYRLKAGRPSELECANNVWQTGAGLPECEADPNDPPEVRCNTPPPCRGVNSEKVGGGASSYAVGEKISYSCIAGYRVRGSNNNDKMGDDVVCKENGEWSDAPECEKKMCPDVAFGDNNRENQPSDKSFGAEYEYQCEANHETNDQTTTRCNAAGVWTLATPPNCIPLRCPKSALPQSDTFNPVNTEFFAVGAKATISCITNHRVAPQGATVTNQFDVECQADGTFTTTNNKCVYTYPTSCQDYFKRDNLFASASSTPQQVTIDMDGVDGPMASFAVMCKKSGDNVCTSISPADDNTLTASVGCDDDDLGDVIDGVALSNDLDGCDTAEVDYGAATSSAITRLISNTKNCQQKVTIECDDEPNVFATIRRHHQTRGLAYNAQGAGIDLDDMNPDVQNGVCDCYNSGNDCTGNGCLCATVDDNVEETDVITFSLDSDNRWVTHIGRAQDAADADSRISASGYDITVGDIECCEAYEA